MRKLLLFIILAALPSWAGVTYTAVTRTILGSKNQSGDFRVRGWVSGSHARMEFLKSELPEIQTGTYLVSSDGGDTVYLVNPAEKTFTRWDVNGMVHNMADMMRTFRGQMKVRFEEPKVEKLLEEAGPEMQGLPTRHFRYRTSYKATLGDTETIATVMDEDIWTTSAIQEPGVKAFLDKRPTTGDEQLDRILNAEMSKVPGFPLKRTTSTQTQTHKQTTVTRSEMEIVELKNVDTPETMFAVPKGFTEVDDQEPTLDQALRKLEKKQREKDAH
ncbi:MAG TPA: DUF4412 domain-containing protein [Terriglobales bacterium]|nr:DUF4412 domain-containing protein [Terriglobales bacterium]